MILRKSVPWLRKATTVVSLAKGDPRAAFLSRAPQPDEPVSRIAQATLLKQPPPATPRPPHILTFVRSYASLQEPKICLESHHFFSNGIEGVVKL